MSPPALITVRGLTKRFGGLTAVADVGFELYPGEILALIGPNGAGKTTVFNLISGVFAPDAGAIEFAGERLDRLPVHRIAARGVLRTFQHNMPFTGLSLTDNILVGRHARFTGSLSDILLGRANVRAEETAARQRAAELIAFVGLADRSDAGVVTLSFGEGRLLEIARALAGEPKAILLDEPAAGLTPAEMTGLVGVIRAIAARGIAVLLIEHDMHFLLPLAHRVVVLNFGRTIAQGTPSEITRDTAVVQAYLGETASGFAQALSNA
jgi:ABC-type branched-subunit amino acid transport system ATPase component